MLFVFMLLAVATCDNHNADPCVSYHPIPDIHRRDPSYTLSHGETPINDREIVEGWYGNPDLTLLNRSPGYFKCGGFYPMWEESNSSAQHASICIVRSNTINCSDPFKIETLKCNGFEVYYLQKAPVHRASYCFESNPDAPPSFKVKPQITVDLNHEQLVSKLLFRCNFTRSSEDLLYKTIWYVNGASVHSFQPAKWTQDYMETTTLTENILNEKGITKAGINIRCAVRAQYHSTGGLSDSELSENRFVGVKIHHWNVYAVKEGETRQLELSITVPFGCGTVISSSLCSFNVEVVTVDDPADCASAVVVENSCGIKPFEADNWHQHSSLTFVGKITSVYGETSGLTHLKLKTPETLYDLSPFWQDYEIGHVTIQVVKNTTTIDYKYCSSDNDPYIRLFDKLWFELSKDGVYTLYKDESRSIEVQVQIQLCTLEELRLRTPFCTCGLAVRAGRTVFEMSICESLVWNIGYSACGDGGDVLTVRREWSTYIIILPTGITIYAYTWPSDVELVNVYLYPTSLDEGKSRGMCGVLSSSNDDDLKMRDGNMATSTDEFAESWRVNDDQNLFNLDNVKRELSSFKPTYQYCTCEETQQDKTITCSAMAASEVCANPEGFDEVKPRDCVIAKRKKRMTRNQLNQARVKRSADNSWPTGWNESAANAYCETKFAESPTVQIVKDVPGVDVSSAMKACVADIKASGTTAFSAVAVASVGIMATREAMVNPVLKKTDPNNPSAPSLFDRITRQTCSADCNGKGTCNEGQCKCNAGYGGGDCSVDLTTPPEILDVGEGGHCDLAAGNCTHAAVVGKLFSGDDNAKCQIRKGKILSKGELNYREVTSSSAVFESLSEVDCTLPEIAEDDIVVLLNISVSHVGDDYSNDLSLLVYDSSCVKVDQSTWVWTVQEGFCVYKGRCVTSGSVRNDNPCMKCTGSSSSTVTWQQSTDDGCTGGKLDIGGPSTGSRHHVFTPLMVVLILSANVYLQ